MKRKVLPFLLSISVLAGSFINQSSYAQDSVANDTTSSFTIVILPDTQYYSESYPEIFMSQTRWIKEYAQELNIKIVLHEGDITNTNTASEWIVAQRSMRVLDGTIPYVITIWEKTEEQTPEILVCLIDIFPSQDTRVQKISVGFLKKVS